MVRVPKMRHRGFFFFSRPTGLLQRSENEMRPSQTHCFSMTAPDCVIAAPRILSWGTETETDSE